MHCAVGLLTSVAFRSSEESSEQQGLKTSVGGPESATIPRKEKFA